MLKKKKHNKTPLQTVSHTVERDHRGTYSNRNNETVNCVFF